MTDEDNNSIPTDDVNRTIISNVAMQVGPPGGQNWNQYKWRHLVAKFVMEVAPPGGAGSTNCKPHLQAMQVTPSDGQNWN